MHRRLDNLADNASGTTPRAWSGYSYDGLNRLIDADRGGSNLQSWDLDSVGNWAGTTIGATQQTREHNKANEITGVSGSWITPAYDAAGNMTSGPKAGAESTRLHYVYDGWNRMIKAHADNNGQPGTLIATYEYDGQGRRIQKTVGSDTLDYFLSEQNQVLETRQAGQLSEQYVWDIRYVDGLILRDVAGGTAGSLDASFGTNGVAYNVAPTINDIKQSVLQRDGKLLIVSEDAILVRLNPDGTLDTTFGDLFNGQRRGWTTLQIPEWWVEAKGLDLLPDGKIIVGGWAGNYDFDNEVQTLLVARYNPNGTLDTTFDGDGIGLVDLVPAAMGFEVVYAMAMQADGKVVLGGEWTHGSMSDMFLTRLAIKPNPQNPQQDMLVLDDSFGTDGVVRTRPGTAAYQGIEALAIDEQGRIVAGTTLNGLWAGRFLSDGSFDSSFGNIVSGTVRSGWTSVAFGPIGGGAEFRAMDLTADGKIVLGGQANSIVLARLLSDGTLDPSFDGNGKASITGPLAIRSLHTLLVEPDGGIVLGGLAFDSLQCNDQLLVGRVTAGGAVDASYGASGWVLVDTDPTNYADERVLSLARQSDGKILASAYTRPGITPGLTVLRLTSGVTRHYAMQDANWNLTGIVDAATGQVVEHYAFTPYGSRTILDESFIERATSSFAWVVGHQGLAYDLETGLVYNRARYLYTSLGRFMIRDPLGYVDGMSVYEYVRSGPTTMRDPSGLTPWSGWGSTGWDLVRGAPVKRAPAPPVPAPPATGRSSRPIRWEKVGEFFRVRAFKLALKGQADRLDRINRGLYTGDPYAPDQEMREASYDVGSFLYEHCPVVRVYAGYSIALGRYGEGGAGVEYVLGEGGSFDGNVTLAPGGGSGMQFGPGGVSVGWFGEQFKFNLNTVGELTVGGSHKGVEVEATINLHRVGNKNYYTGTSLGSDFRLPLEYSQPVPGIPPTLPPVFNANPPHDPAPDITATWDYPRFVIPGLEPHWLRKQRAVEVYIRIEVDGDDGDYFGGGFIFKL